MKTTVYRLPSGRFLKKLRLALVSDLHAEAPDDVINVLKKEKPDAILMAGDILEPLDGSCDAKNEKAFSVFSQSAKIAPTFYCTGNHEDGGVHSQSKKWKENHNTERIYTKKNTDRILSSGVHFLLDCYVVHDGIAYGGLCSGLIKEGNKPNLEFLTEFAKLDMPKILICHHPEYYEKYIRKLDIDLIVSGHAHGGQWRFFGKGVYAPGQGLFPKYTSGVHEGRLVVSRGLLKSKSIPRIFNPTEVVMIEIG